MTEQILDIVLNAQNGGAAAAAGRLVGLSPEDAVAACRRLVPEIAGRARDKAETDREAYAELIDLIEDDSTAAVLDDPAALAAPESRADGESILTALYGAPDPAITGAGKAGAMVPLIAVLTFAAIARRGRATMLGAANMPERGSGGSGILGAILSALLAGLVKGLMQTLQRRTSAYGRRRPAYGTRRSRAAPTRRRQARQPSLDDIFGEILRRR
ncbi:MAG: hypothetical protein ABWZ27_13065 [Aestuariivirgaceae bacterium]